MCIVATLTPAAAHAQSSVAADTYVVTLQHAEAAVDGRAAAAQLAASYGGEFVQTGDAAAGAYTVRIDAGRARLLAGDGRVASVVSIRGAVAVTTWSSGLTYTYDGSGNITRGGSDAFTYDAFNRLGTSTVSARRVRILMTSTATGEAAWKAPSVPARSGG